MIVKALPGSTVRRGGVQCASCRRAHLPSSPADHTYRCRRRSRSNERSSALLSPASPVTHDLRSFPARRSTPTRTSLSGGTSTRTSAQRNTLTLSFLKPTADTFKSLKPMLGNKANNALATERHHIAHRANLKPKLGLNNVFNYESKRMKMMMHRNHYSEKSLG